MSDTKTFEQFCAEQTHTLGAPVEDVSPTICRLANEYGRYLVKADLRGIELPDMPVIAECSVRVKRVPRDIEGKL